MILEKSADDLDMASQLQEQQNEQALERMRAVPKVQTHPDFDGEHCVECEVDMPTERLAAGRVRCTICESAIEVKLKFRGVRW
jgi:hypothetical protein